MPTAATPRASVRRSSSCFVSNRMECLHPCGVEIKPGGEKRCDGHHADGDCCVSQGTEKKDGSGEGQGQHQSPAKEIACPSVRVKQRGCFNPPHGSPCGRDRRAQMPKSSLSVRPVEAIDCALARSSSLFLGVEKPWPVPL